MNFVGLAEDPVPYYSAADALVLPTFSDSCSLAVLEAAASGLPSVTTQFNGAAELLTDGVDGYVLADPSDDGQLADRLRRLLNPALRRAWARPRGARLSSTPSSATATRSWPCIAS